MYDELDWVEDLNQLDEEWNIPEIALLLLRDEGVDIEGLAHPLWRSVEGSRPEAVANRVFFFDEETGEPCYECIVEGKMLRSHREIDWDLFAELTDQDTATLSPNPADVSQPGTFPRFWRLFAYILPPAVRERVSSPLTRISWPTTAETSAYRTKWSKRWLKVCFTVRTGCLIVSCLRSWFVGDVLLGLLFLLLPRSAVLWVRQFFRLP